MLIRSPFDYYVKGSFQIVQNAPLIDAARLLETLHNLINVYAWLFFSKNKFIGKESIFMC